MREPTGWKKPDVYADKKPPVDIELEWIHGYRGSQARNNLSVLLDGNITYFAAGVGVVLDSSTNKHNQRFFTKHTDDIMAMAFSPDKRLVATGENGKRPVTYIWDALSM